MGGQFWVGGWYYYGSPFMVSFFREVCGLSLDEKIEHAADAYSKTAQSACWWWPHKDFVIVSERPTEINRDEQGRLHCPSGPSIAWSDGWSLYHWHGIRVTERAIMRPETFTADELRAEQNSEVVRAIAECLGWEKFLDKIGAKTIDTFTGNAGFKQEA
jgi:hypothetical protein